ncbi:hypothetical protein F511_27036 [Dorcoceras hygrometricum]|uniref:Uncharacterized protein n=1 Tax=Dorcoceras hygrometricum TaxID=472368 RepID=A0A2Z7CH76_9LAMI|nr:hypothetical protein F511_27036 [Dorcoceras hygrometricum]
MRAAAPCDDTNSTPLDLPDPVRTGALIPRLDIQAQDIPWLNISIHKYISGTQGWDLPADVPLGPTGLPEESAKANTDQSSPKTGKINEANNSAGNSNLKGASTPRTTKSAGGNHRSVIFRCDKQPTIIVQWYSDATTQSATTSMIALDLSGATTQLANKNASSIRKSIKFRLNIQSYSESQSLKSGRYLRSGRHLNLSANSDLTLLHYPRSQSLNELALKSASKQTDLARRSRFEAVSSKDDVSFISRQQAVISNYDVSNISRQPDGSAIVTSAYLLKMQKIEKRGC